MQCYPSRLGFMIVGGNDSSFVKTYSAVVHNLFFKMSPFNLLLDNARNGSVGSVERETAGIELMSFLKLFQWAVLLVIVLFGGLVFLRFIRFFYRTFLKLNRNSRLHAYIYVLLVYSVLCIPSAVSNSKSSEEIRSVVRSNLFAPAASMGRSLLKGSLLPSTLSPNAERTISVASVIFSAVRTALFEYPLSTALVPTAFPQHARSSSAAAVRDKYICEIKPLDDKRGVFLGLTAAQLFSYEKRHKNYFTASIPAAFLSLLLGTIML